MSNDSQTNNEDITNYMNAPIGVSDAAAMFRRRLLPNMTPYESTVINLNNRLVDEWENRMLLKMCNRSGKMPSANVWTTWSIFWEGKNMHIGREILEHKWSIPEDVARWWIKYLSDASVLSISEGGAVTASYGREMIVRALRDHFAAEKWSVIYSSSDDPSVWIKKANSNPRTLNQKNYPFSLTEEKYSTIMEKMRYALSVGPHFERLSQGKVKVSTLIETVRRPIPPNTRPYEEQAIRACNKIIEQWREKVLNKICDKSGFVDSQEAAETWTIFSEGRELHLRNLLREHLIPIPDDVAMWWAKFFVSSPIEHIHSLGVGNALNGWGVLVMAMKEHFAEKKWHLVYSQSTDPVEWFAAAKNHRELMEGKLFPFGLTQEDITDCNQKIQTLSKNIPQPN
jgi:hypothetical protein